MDTKWAEVTTTDRPLPSWLRALVCEARARAAGSSLPLVIVPGGQGHRYIIVHADDFRAYFGDFEMTDGQTL